MIFIIFGLFFMGISQNNTISKWASIIGTEATIIGLALTLVQLKAVKDTAEATNVEVANAVRRSQDRIRDVLSVSDFTSTLRIIDIIDSYIKDNKFELAVSKLKEVQKTLIIVRSTDDFVKNIDKKVDLSDIINSLNLDINNLFENIDTPKNIQKSEIWPRLRIISDIIISIESYLKNKSYE